MLNKFKKLSGKKVATKEDHNTKKDGKQERQNDVPRQNDAPLRQNDAPIKSTVFNPDATSEKEEKEEKKSDSLAFLSATMTSLVNSIGVLIGGVECLMTKQEQVAITQANKNYLETIEMTEMPPELVLLLAYSPYLIKVGTSSKFLKMFKKDSSKVDTLKSSIEQGKANGLHVVEGE